VGGDSEEVLLKVDAKCLNGQEDEVRRRVMRALGHAADDQRNLAVYRP
jgi:hypothetical protein